MLVLLSSLLDAFTPLLKHGPSLTMACRRTVCYLSIGIGTLILHMCIVSN